MNINKYLIFILIFVAFLIASCNNKKDAFPLNVIQVASTVGTYNTLNLSGYVSEIKYVPLETDLTFLVGRSPRICHENGYILISNFQDCYLFDIDGKFCQKIGERGEGPGEYLSNMQSFIYTNVIYINDFRKIITYDMNGRLIESINLWSNDIPNNYSGTGGSYLLPLKKDTFVMNATSLKGYYPKSLLFEKKSSGAKMIKEYPNSILLDKLKKGVKTKEEGTIYRFQNGLRIYKGINDTIFSIDKKSEMRSAFIFHLGEYRAPLTYWEWKEKDTYDNYIFPRSISESINYLFIEFSFGKHAPESFVYDIPSRGTQATNSIVYGLFDKRTGKLTLMRQPQKGKLGLKNDVDNGPVIWPSYITPNDELVSLISPEEFMEYYENNPNPSAELTEVANKLELDDNPIVIVAKLK